MRYRGVLPIGQIAHLSNIWQSTQKGEKQRPIAHLSNIWQSTQKGKSTDNCHQYLLPLQVLLNLWMEVIVDGGDNHLSRCKLKHTVSSNNAKLQGCSLLSFALYMYIEIVLNIDTNSCMYQINVDNNYLFFSMVLDSFYKLRSQHIVMATILVPNMKFYFYQFSVQQTTVKFDNIMSIDFGLTDLD